MKTARQSSIAPTNKLAVAALIAPAATEAWGSVMAGVYAPVSGPEMSMLVGACASLLVGYFIPDRPNVPT